MTSQKNFSKFISSDKSYPVVTLYYVLYEPLLCLPYFCNRAGSYYCLNQTESEGLYPVDPEVPGGRPEEHLCDDGYEYDYEESVCRDVDECELALVDCGAGTCVNREPGYECSCAPGHRFDGDTCTDVDECAETGELCGPHGECLNESGSFSCQCHMGFRQDGNGSLCADVDECLDRCLEHGRCTNEEGGFSCECNPGFRLDGEEENCVDVDECVEIVERGGRRPCGRARKVLITCTAPLDRMVYPKLLTVTLTMLMSQSSVSCT